MPCASVRVETLNLKVFRVEQKVQALRTPNPKPSLKPETRKDVINLKLMTLGDVGVGKSTLVLRPGGAAIRA